MDKDRSGARQAPHRRKRAKKGRGRRFYLLVFLGIPALVAAALSIAIPVALQRGNDFMEAFAGLSVPAYVANASPNVQEAYAYVVEHPEAVRYIPCFCGCGVHSGHTSVHDCFVKVGHLSGGPVVFDPHGASCAMCVNTVLDTKRLLQQGKTLQEAREYIVERYGGLGPGTNTPPIPG